MQGDIVIDVPPESQVHKQVVRKRAEVLDITLNPSTRLYYVEVEEPDMHNPSGDLERLVAALESQWQLKNSGRFQHSATDAANPTQRWLDRHMCGASCR